MDRKVIPETENRLVILYAAERLGPVTGMQLLRFMVEGDLMNYITLQLSLSELEEQGKMVRRAHPCGELWELTEEGRYVRENFERHIPASRREMMDERAREYRARFRQEQLAPADALTLADGTACIRLRLLEERAAIMDLLLYVPAAQVPTVLEERWYASAQAVYEAVMAALTKDYKPDASLPEVPEGAAREMGSGEWLLSLSDREDKPSISLLMPLPGEHLARWCASRWPGACEALRSLILEQLDKASGATVPVEKVSDKGE